MPTYNKMLKTYTYVQKDKYWKPHQRGVTLGRVNNVSVSAGDVFYLCMLLHHDPCHGKTSFSDMKIVDGIEYTSYQAVFRQLGLLNDNDELHKVLE